MAKLYFRYSAMNAGKSTSLLQVAHNYEEQGGRVELYTAAIDDRYGVGKVTSRLGPQREALVYDGSFDFVAALSDTHWTNRLELSCLLVDEAQFLSPQQVQQLHRLAHLADIPVICFGLRSDFRGEPFPGAAYLLSLSDTIEELKTICSCKSRATMNMRVDENGEMVSAGKQVEIGGNSRYQPVCATCFYQNSERLLSALA
jgi:thymidine kinase